MHRVITAIYPTYAAAAEVRTALEHLGVPGAHVHVIPDAEDLTEAGTTRDITTFNQRLHDLDLPEDDTRTYQQAIRNGDYIVSVEVDDAERLDRIKTIMRDPGEARDIDALDHEYHGAGYIPFRHEDRPAEPRDRAVRENPQPGERADLRGYTRSEGAGRRPGEVPPR
jgi:hypothetical protein